MKPKRSVRCQICERKFTDKYHLIEHIDRIHKDQIPQDWSAARYECYLRTGKSEGKCIYCGKPTGFNEKTGKYFRICKNPKCRKTASDLADKRMIGKYGKVTLLNDPEQQRLMIYSKRTSGKYAFEDPDDPRIKYIAMYDSSLGKDFFEMLDNFLMLSGQDIIAPSPHTYYYEYEGKEHYYIPDAYIVSLNLEVELKDGGDNPNNHPKIQAVDKKKEELKDAIMESLKNQVNYIKIVNKQYGPFFALLSELRERDIVYLPKWDTASNHTQTFEGYSDLIEYIPNVNILGQELGPIRELKQTALLFDPSVSYDKLVDSLYKEALRCRNPQKIVMLDSKARAYQAHLAQIANSQNDEDSRMKFEAGRASKKLLNKVIPFIEKRTNDIERAQKVRQSINEECWVLDNSYIVTEGDMSNVDDTRVPVYIVLTDTGTAVSKVIKKVTGDPYNHASLSLDTSLQRMFSFNMRGNGFDIESIDMDFYGAHKDTVRYAVYAYMATPYEFHLVRDAIDNMRNQAERFRYSVKGLIGFFSKHKQLYDNEMVCSEFVAEMIKAMNPDVITKPRNQYKPYDLPKIKNTVFIQRGILKNFSPVELKKKTEEKLRKVGFKLWDEMYTN